MAGAQHGQLFVLICAGFGHGATLRRTEVRSFELGRDTIDLRLGHNELIGVSARACVAWREHVRTDLLGFIRLEHGIRGKIGGVSIDTATIYYTSLHVLDVDLFANLFQLIVLRHASRIFRMADKLVGHKNAVLPSSLAFHPKDIATTRVIRCYKSQIRMPVLRLITARTVYLLLVFAAMSGTL